MLVEAFLRATAKGWQHWADKNRDQAVDMLVKEYPNLNRADERVAVDVMLAYSFGDASRRRRAGARWTRPSGRSRSRLYSELGQFTARTPKVEDVITLDVLKATQAARKA